MGILSLTRRAGESVQLGDSSLITVTDVRQGCVTLQVRETTKDPKSPDYCAMQLKYGKPLQLVSIGCLIELYAVQGGTARLSFTAPRELHIVRTELLK